MTEPDTERPPADPTLPPPPALPNPETERILRAIYELGKQIELAGGIATEAQATVEDTISRLDRVSRRLEEVAAKQSLIAEQAESAIGMAATAHQKIDRIYDQLHALCEHQGCPILGVSDSIGPELPLRGPSQVR